MRIGLSTTLLAAAMATMLGTPIASNAQSPEEFYKGKTVRMLIASPTGDSYDLWGRLIARHMTKHIPGNPNVLPQNMPGSDGLVGANHLYNVAPKDGTMFGTFSRNLPTRALLKQPSVQFDPLKFNWLGSPELVNRVCSAMTNSPVQKAEDIFTTELIVGGVGSNSIQSTMPTILNKVLGTKFKLIEGYVGAQDIYLAMERGELHGVCLSYSQLKGPKSDWVREGKIRVLFNMETKAFTELPNVPSIHKFVKSDEHRQILGFLNASIELGRPFAAPPGTPDYLVAALRKAFDATLKDPELLEEAGKMKFEVTYTSSDELMTLIQGLYATPEDVIKKAQQLSGS